MSILALTLVLALGATTDTPAARQLASWLTAFNSADQATMVAYHTRHFPYAAASRDLADIERELGLSRASGGFDLRKTEQGTTHETFLLDQPGMGITLRKGGLRLIELAACLGNHAECREGVAHAVLIIDTLGQLQGFRCGSFCAMLHLPMAHQGSC